MWCGHRERGGARGRSRAGLPPSEPARRFSPEQARIRRAAGREVSKSWWTPPWLSESYGDSSRVSWRRWRVPCTTWFSRYWFGARPSFRACRVGNVRCVREFLVGLQLFKTAGTRRNFRQGFDKKETAMLRTDERTHTQAEKNNERERARIEQTEDQIGRAH